MENRNRNEKNRVKAKTCDPLESMEDIEKLRLTLLRQDGRNGLRDALIVTLGCNLGLRVSDLCRLKVEDILDKEYLEIAETKTGKPRKIKINKKVAESVEFYVKAKDMPEYKYLFGSQKGGHLMPKHIHKIIKAAARKAEIGGNIGTHSLRKTMAYHAFKNNANDPSILGEIMVMFNHTSIETTRRYIANSRNRDRVYTSLNL